MALLLPRLVNHSVRVRARAVVSLEWNARLALTLAPVEVGVGGPRHRTLELVVRLVVVRAFALQRLKGDFVEELSFVGVVGIASRYFVLSFSIVVSGTFFAFLSLSNLVEDCGSLLFVPQEALCAFATNGLLVPGVVTGADVLRTVSLPFVHHIVQVAGFLL